MNFIPGDLVKVVSGPRLLYSRPDYINLKYKDCSAGLFDQNAVGCVISTSAFSSSLISRKNYYEVFVVTNKCAGWIYEGYITKM